MKIGELAKHVGVNVDAIRYYEQRQLMLPPARTAAGYRSYEASDVKRLRFIVQAKAMGFTLSEIKSLLSLRAGKVDCAEVRAFARQKADDIAVRIDSLNRIKKVLDKLSEKCAQDEDDNCPILRALEGFDDA